MSQSSPAVVRGRSAPRTGAALLRPSDSCRSVRQRATSASWMPFHWSGRRAGHRKPTRSRSQCHCVTDASISPVGGVAVVLEELRGRPRHRRRRDRSGRRRRVSPCSSDQDASSKPSGVSPSVPSSRTPGTARPRGSSVQFLGLLLQRLDLREGEHVGRAVVPVLDRRPVLALGPGVDQPGLLDLPLPVRPLVNSTRSSATEPPCSPDRRSHPSTRNCRGRRRRTPRSCGRERGPSADTVSPTAGTFVVRLLLSGRKYQPACPPWLLQSSSAAASGSRCRGRSSR